MNKNDFIKVVKFLKDAIKDTKFDKHVFLVGGCVRDYILNEEIQDIDIVIDLLNGAEEFSKWITKKENCWSTTNPYTIGKKGTYSFRITTNQDIQDVHFDCVQTKKNPSYSSYQGLQNLGTIREDSVLRDLTINSLYLDVSSAEIFDLNGGQEDMQKQLLRTPNNPTVIFKDDPLRMMRIIRFSSIYGWDIEKETWLGIVKNHKLIKEVSVERFRDELNKILLSPMPSVGLYRMLYSGILYDMIPELYELNQLECSKGIYSFYRTQLDHTFSVVNNVKPCILNRLAALFHDVGKPLTKKMRFGEYTFYGHESKGAELSVDILSRLRYKHLTIDCVSNCIMNHKRFNVNEKITNKSIRKFLVDVGKYKNVAINLIKGNEISKGKQEAFLKLEEQINEVMNEMDFEQIKLPINGKDICEELKLKESPLIGELLNHVKENFLSNPNMSKQEALSIARQYVVEHSYKNQ